jgi:transposase-like protein
VSAKSASDLDLLEQALTKAGGVAALAAALGVRENTPHVWVTRLRNGGALSPDKRHRLTVYLGGASGTAGDETLALRQAAQAALGRVREVMGEYETAARHLRDVERELARLSGERARKPRRRKGAV